MAAYKIQRSDGEPIWLGTPAEISELLDQPGFNHYGVWTDQNGHYMICRSVPAPSYVEITHRQFWNATA